MSWTKGKSTMATGKYDPFDMDERVRNYLESKRSMGKDDPQYIYGKGAIETAGLQGIAGGMAQLGTVHGKTPSVQPYIDSSTKALGGIQSLAKEPLIDPQVMEYIKSRTKHPGATAAPKVAEWKRGQVAPNGDQYWYRTNQDGTLETKIEGKAHMAEPAGSTALKKTEGAANATAYTGQAQMGIFKRMEDDFDKAYKDGYAGPTAGKIYGLKSKYGKDVSPEFDRLRNDSERDLIEYVKAMSGTAASDKERKNIQSTLPTPDLDPGQFKIRMQATKEKLLQTINSKLLENGYSPMTMEDMEAGRTPIRPGNKAAPAAAPSTPKRSLTPAEKAELEERRKRKTSGVAK